MMLKPTSPPVCISHISYISLHHTSSVNPVQERVFNGVLYKLWSLLMPWLALSR